MSYSDSQNSSENSLTITRNEIDETLQRLAKFEQLGQDQFRPDTFHDLVSCQIGKFKERARNSEKSSGQLRVRIKTYSVVHPKNSNTGLNCGSTKKLYSVAPVSGFEESVRDIVPNDSSVLVYTDNPDKNVEKVKKLLEQYKAMARSDKNKCSRSKRRHSKEHEIDTSNNFTTRDPKKLTKIPPQSQSPLSGRSIIKKSEISKNKIPFTPETPYTPLKQTTLPNAFKKTRSVKWTCASKNLLGDEIEEQSITSDKLASIILASSMAKQTKRKTKSPFNLSSKYTAINIFPMTDSIENGHKTRIAPRVIYTTQMNELSKMELEALNVKENFSKHEILENISDFESTTFKLVNELIKQSSVSKNEPGDLNMPMPKVPVSPETNYLDTTFKRSSPSGKTIQKLVHLAEPENYDIVQLRGSTNPKWLKNPILSLPQQNSTFERTPLNKMLQKMWREMSPFLE